MSLLIHPIASACDGRSCVFDMVSPYAQTLIAQLNTTGACVLVNYFGHNPLLVMHAQQIFFQLEVATKYKTRQ
jgi:hypothetical protein